MVITTKQTTSFHLNSKETRALLSILVGYSAFVKNSVSNEDRIYGNFALKMAQDIKKSMEDAK